jgi:4-hydroxybenzoate polyprenyltransferase
LAELAALAAGGRILAQFGVGLYCLHLAWQLSRVEGATPKIALDVFRSNRHAGLILFAGLALDGWMWRFFV